MERFRKDDSLAIRSSVCVEAFLWGSLLSAPRALLFVILKFPMIFIISAIFGWSRGSQPDNPLNLPV
jgi:hypothetical protein